MELDKNIDRYCIRVTSTIKEALRQFNDNQLRTIICVGVDGKLAGSVSLGDINRWILREESPDINQSISLVMNIEVHFEKDGAFSDLVHKNVVRYNLVPVVDSRMHVLGILTEGGDSKTVNVATFPISNDSKPFIIAEIGNNHNGSIKSALNLVKLASSAGADSVKFQLRDMSTLYGAGAIGHSENLGTEYTLDLLEKFQLKNSELKEVMAFAEDLGLIPLCTPWDEASVDVLETFNVAGYKIASADLTNHSLLRYIAAMRKPMICSTGMATEDEIKESVEVLNSCSAEFVLLHCNSTYPAPFKDINLRYLNKLKEISGGLVGYSGHERGGSVAVAAVALGARVIEKHLTDDRAKEGNDHKVSLLPDEFKSMVIGINETFEALGHDKPRKVTQGEMMNRVTLAKSVYAAKDLSAGTMLSMEDLIVKSPGRGLQPNYIEQLLSVPLKRNLLAGEIFYPDDLIDEKVCPKKDYGFSGNWGIPVRHHDYMDLFKKVECPILEFHLSYKDLDLNIHEYFGEQINAELVVHAPELFYGDHTLDITSLDDEYLDRSIKEMQKTIRVVKELKQFFTNSKRRIGLITNIGGFSNQDRMSPEELQKRTEKFKKSLEILADEEVELWPQTMPPFPWHFGGQQYHNLFLDGRWIDAICEETGIKVCLDISHSALECNHRKKSFSQFLDLVMPHTAHLHLADASGVDAEGLQIGEGTVDWQLVLEKMLAHCPDASWIPEIWQGHENGGHGFWVSLERLAKVGF